MPIVQDDLPVPGHDHVLLLADSSDRPFYETVPATMVAQGVYDILGSPALTYGCAAGDRVRVAADGTFHVLRRGGNLCLRVFLRTAPTDDDVDALSATFSPIGGLVEMPADRKFIVITVSVSAGFVPIEQAVRRWTADRDCQWEYGNVHDEHGELLGWWTPT
jgi:hypothetical protein